MEESWEVLKFMTLRNGKISCVAYMDLSKNTVPCKHWSNQIFTTENNPLGGRMADVDWAGWVKKWKLLSRMRSLRRDHQSEIRGAHQNQNRDLVSWWLGRDNSLSIGYHLDSPENKGPENTMFYHHVPIKSAIQFFVGEKTMFRQIYINIILLVLDIQLYSLHAHSGWS